MNPYQALRFWGVHSGAKPKFLPVGIFNDTYEVRSPNGLFFLQKLNALISGDEPTENYASITRFLRSRGFPTQEIVPAKNGALLVRRGDETWRLMRGVKGAIYTVAPSLGAVEGAGICLGKTHRALNNFRKKLRPVLPMFQYGEVYAKLKTYRRRFKKDKTAREAAVFLIEKFPKCFLPAGLPRRIIHTDPKISNFVFRGEKAIVMIDWDTAQKLSPLYDVGDAVRSFCGGKEDDSQNKFNFPKYNALLRGYLAGSKNCLSRKEEGLIPQASGLVMLGLAARFLNDYIDDFYFGWDKKRYRSRKEHNLARAIGQIALYKDFCAKMNFLPVRPR